MGLLKEQSASSSDSDADSLKAPHGSGRAGSSQHARLESSHSRWWQRFFFGAGLSESMTSGESENLGEDDEKPLPWHPAEGERRSRAIDNYLAAESRRTNRELKMLLFGNEQQKDIFWKQARLLESPLSSEELEGLRSEARRVLVARCRDCLLEAVDDTSARQLPIDSSPILERLVKSVSQEDTDGENTSDEIIGLYRDDTLRPALQQHRISLEDIERRHLEMFCPSYLSCPVCPDRAFEAQLDRIFSPEYVPTHHDWFHFDNRRYGPMMREARVDRDSHALRLLDITKTSTERRKWIHTFEDMACLVFLSDLALYDTTLCEDQSMNRLHEEMVLFESVVNSRWFRQKPFFLILSNVAAFREKLPISQLSRTFPEFAEGKNADEAVNFIRGQFRKRVKTGGDVCIHTSEVCTADGVSATLRALESTALCTLLGDLGIHSTQ